jgi:hypothetical protein
LGPAIIAALATYKATKAQYESKIRELDKNQSFKAREALLQHYKEQKSNVDSGYVALSETIASILGFISSEQNNIDEQAETVVGIADMYIGLAPFDTEKTLRDMKVLKLGQTVEFEKLNSYLQPAKDLKVTKGLNETKSNIYFLLKLYAYLGRCNQMLLEKQTEELFGTYVNEEK